MTLLRKGIYIALMFCVPLLITGCLEIEGLSVSLDLNKNICTVIFYGLGSDETEEAKIEHDFQALIKHLSELRSEGKDLTSELYSEGTKLNGKRVFRFNEAFLTTERLQNYQLEIDGAGYFVSIPDSDQDALKGNGEIVQEGAKKRMRWPKTAKLIQYEIKMPQGSKNDKIITNLLPRWQNWNRQHQSGEMNIMKPEKKAIQK